MSLKYLDKSFKNFCLLHNELSWCIILYFHFLHSSSLLSQWIPKERGQIMFSLFKALLLLSRPLLFHWEHLQCKRVNIFNSSSCVIIFSFDSITEEFHTYICVHTQVYFFWRCTKKQKPVVTYRIRNLLGKMMLWKHFLNTVRRNRMMSLSHELGMWWCLLGNIFS